jgi:hypothetical protein
MDDGFHHRDDEAAASGRLSMKGGVMSDDHDHTIAGAA